MLEKKSFTTTINEVPITASFTNLAEKANGSVLIEAGDTVVFTTAVMSDYEADKDYFPLSVEFEERFYSIGAILGSRYVRREGRPSQEAILNARIIDRTIRPLFPKGLHNEVQVIATVLSFGTYNPDVLAVLGASLAIGSSDIPWDGPVSGVRFCRSESGEWQPFLPFDEAKKSPDHFLVCGKKDTITMIEMEGKEVSEESINTVAEEALKHIGALQKFQEDIIKEIGKEKKSVSAGVVPQNLVGVFDSEVRPELQRAIFSSGEKSEVGGGVDAVEKVWKEMLQERDVDAALQRLALAHFHDVVDEIIHTEAVENEKRADGRKIDEVRNLYAQAGGVSPRLHGSGTFYRGGTHVLTVLTLGSPRDALSLNTVEDPDTDERFMHHYNFPPFSGGEVGRVGSPKRREIGHGALAEKALRNVLPSKDDFPYTMRLVSECFSSNGSTSMGSVCASTLALLDGGVPISAPVAGIAMGLMQKGDKYKVLTDIQGPEDHHGDMDFKVAGTKDGVTAIQMDVKIEGITTKILSEALTRGRDARLHILETIMKEIASPRSGLSAYAPNIQSITIDPEYIGMVIGSGGKTINKLRDDTGVDSIDIEDDGTVSVSGNKESVAQAIEKIESMTRSFEVGETMEGAVKSITDFGAFVELTPDKDGMVHISEFSPQRVGHAGDVVSVGDIVPVVVKEIRDDGRVALSIKDRDPTFFDEAMKNVSPGGGGGRHREGRGGDRGERRGRGGERRGGGRGGDRKFSKQGGGRDGGGQRRGGFR